MTNTEILTAVIAEWAKPMTDDIIKQVANGNEKVARANAWIKKFFPVSENYSIWNDLSFLAMPLIELSIQPMLASGLAKMGISDEAIPAYAHKVVDALCKEADEKGQVRLLERYTLTADDTKRLKEMLGEAMPER